MTSPHMIPFCYNFFTSKQDFRKRIHLFPIADHHDHCKGGEQLSKKHQRLNLLQAEASKWCDVHLFARHPMV